MQPSKSLRAALAAAASIVSFSIVSNASAAVIYNPVVTMIGDGTAVVSGQSRTTTLRVYANTTPAQPAPLSELAFNSTANGVRLTNSDSASSEGGLTNNPGTSDAAAVGAAYNGNIYTYSSGYDATNATTAVIGAAANAPRTIGYMNANNNSLSGATVPFTHTQAAAYNNNNIRSATGNDAATDFWWGGTGDTASLGGWRYVNTNTQVSATVTNVRSVEIRNGQLFGSTGSGANRGIYAIGSGTPQGAGNTAANLFNTGGSSSPYEFVLINDPNNAADVSTTFGYDTAYIADDSTTGANNGGIQKWVWNGAAWSNVYTMAGARPRGLAGQYDPDQQTTVLWASDQDGTKLYQVTDTGVGSTFVTLATAPANNVFRGVALSTNVPEPMGLSVIWIGLALGLRRRTN